MPEAPRFLQIRVLLQEAVLSGKEAKLRARLVHSLAHQILSKVAALYLSTLHRCPSPGCSHQILSYLWLHCRLMTQLAKQPGFWLEQLC